VSDVFLLSVKSRRHVVGGILRVWTRPKMW